MKTAKLRELLETCAELVSWQCDTEASENDTSPVDMVAHINGLVWQKIQLALKELGK